MSSTTHPLHPDLRCRGQLNTQHLIRLRLQPTLVHRSVELKNRNIPTVAELGPGTGSWLLDLARELPPWARLDGYDIDIRQTPHPNWTPENVRFRVNDAYGEFPRHARGRYDLVHLRCLICGVRDCDPGRLLGNIRQLLKPGGYVQWTEMDAYTIRVVKASPEIRAPATEKLVESFEDIVHRRAGSRPGWVAALHETFGECGFEAIEVDQRIMGDSDLVSWHDNAFFSLENFGLSADDGGEMERLLDEAGKESTDNRRGVAITGDSVTVIGRWPGPG